MDRNWSPDRAGAELVKAALVLAFRECIARPIWSMPGGHLALVSGHHMSGIELVLATAAVLGRNSDKRTALLGWARAKAGGPPFSKLCADLGWNRSTADAWVAEAALSVAVAFHAVVSGALELDRDYGLGKTSPPQLTVGKARPEPAQIR